MSNRGNEQPLGSFFNMRRRKEGILTVYSGVINLEFGKFVGTFIYEHVSRSRGLEGQDPPLNACFYVLHKTTCLMPPYKTTPRSYNLRFATQFT